MINHYDGASLFGGGGDPETSLLPPCTKCWSLGSPFGIGRKAQYIYEYHENWGWFTYSNSIWYSSGSAY